MEISFFAKDDNANWTYKQSALPSDEPNWRNNCNGSGGRNSKILECFSKQAKEVKPIEHAVFDVVEMTVVICK